MSEHQLQTATELSAAELQAQEATELPAREAMTVLTPPHPGPVPYPPGRDEWNVILGPDDTVITPYPKE